MYSRLALKDPIRENHLFRTRAYVAGASTVLLIAALVVRLVYVQVLDHDLYTTLSHNNRVSIQPLPPTRGLIYDRKGVLLADNILTFSLELIPELVEDMEATLAAVRELVALTADDEARFRREMRRHRRFDAVPLRFRLSDEEVARIALDRYRLPGVEINARPLRYYPFTASTAHSVGYVGRINEAELKQLDPSNYAGTDYVGKVGVEKHHEDLLHGQVGYQQVETNARGRVLRVLESLPPIPGRNLHLSLDIGLQRIIEQAFGGERGALVAIEPRTGNVLALVSNPSYDPNLFVNGIPASIYRELNTSADRPLYNRAVRGAYPPGSTIKPFVALGGVEMNQISSSTKVYCPGSYQLKGQDHRYRDWKRGGHGTVDLHEAIVESCDVYFYDLAHKLGIDRLSDYLQRFGFGRRTGIDTGGEAEGLMPTRDWKRRARNQPWYPGETLIAGIGQGYVLATPVQLASATATLAARGRHMQPRLAQAQEDPATGVVEPLPPLELGRIPVDSGENWDRVIGAMTDVVHSQRGTAKRIAQGIGYRIAGKTGTAQVFGIGQKERYSESKIDKRLRDHALFVAFAPVDEPTIAVGIIVENGGHGGAVAAPLARVAMDYYLLGIAPQTMPNLEEAD